MSSYYSSQPSGPSEVEIRICSAQDLKNISWKHGPLKPYAVVWVDPRAKSTTRVDEHGDTSPNWDEKLIIPLPPPPPPPPYNSPPPVISSSTYLFIDIVHFKSSDEDIKPLIGSVRVPLKEIVDEVGMGEWAHRKLHLKRPSGRPHGKLDVEIKVRESRAPDPYYAPPYGVPPPPATAPPYSSSSSAARDYPTSGLYPYSSSGGALPPSGYPYGQNPAPQQPAYGQPAYAGEYGGMPAKKDSKFGMGTGIAVGAVAGVLGGLAISEGIDHLEDSIADDVTERVEDDLGYDDDDY